MTGRLLPGAVVLAVLVAAGASPAWAVDGDKPAPPAEAPAEGPPRQGPVDVTQRRTRDLYLACLAEQGAASGWCSAYLLGVADTLTAFGNGGDKGGLCDVDYSIEQLAETFLTWARTHDALSQIDMLAGVTLAFRQRWPCR